MSGYNLAEVLRGQLQGQAPAERSIESITAEIIQRKQNAGKEIIAIGNCLIEAKAMLSEGEWLTWLSDQVDFSPRTAQRFMRLAKEWTDATALSHLGATKALTLLALPPEERETFMAENNVVDMTSRELEKALRERDEARKAAETAQADARTAEESRAKMEQDMKALNALYQSAKESEMEARDALEAAERDLYELQERPVDVAVETVVDQEAVEKARSEAIAEMKAKVEKAEAARGVAEKKLREAEKKLTKVARQAGDTAALGLRAAAAEAEMDKLRNQLRTAEQNAKLEKAKQNEDIALFDVLFNQTQENLNKMHGIVIKAAKEDGKLADALYESLSALHKAIGRCLDELEE